MISGQFPPRVSSGVRPCRVHTASMIDTLSENCFSSGFKFMSHSGVIMPHVKVDQAISLHTTPSFFSPSTGEGEYLPFFFPFLIISLPNGKRRSSIRRFPFLARRSGAICIPFARRMMSREAGWIGGGSRCINIGGWRNKRGPRFPVGRDQGLASTVQALNQEVL